MNKGGGTRLGDTAEGRQQNISCRVPTNEWENANSLEGSHGAREVDP